MENVMNSIILTVNLQGQLGAPVSHKSSKETVSKVKTSPFEKGIYDKKGNVSYITPKGLYLASNDFKPREVGRCTKNIHLSEDIVKSFLKTPPFGVKDFIWKNMSQPQKLRSHLDKYDEGFGYTFQEL